MVLLWRLTLALVAGACFGCIAGPQAGSEVHISKGVTAKVGVLREVDREFKSTYWGPEGSVVKPIQEVEELGGQAYVDSPKERLVDLWIQFAGLDPGKTEKGEYPNVDASIGGIMVFPLPAAPKSSIIGEVKLPKSMRIGDLKLGVARGAYEPIAMKGPILVKETEEATSLTEPNGSKMYGTTFLIRVPTDTEGKDILARAHMKSGYVVGLLLTTKPDEKINGVTCRRAYECPCRLGDVVKVELFQRPMTWVTLPNIHLYPNK